MNILRNSRELFQLYYIATLRSLSNLFRSVLKQKYFEVDTHLACDNSLTGSIVAINMSYLKLEYSPDKYHLPTCRGCSSEIHSVGTTVF